MLQCNQCSNNFEYPKKEYKRQTEKFSRNTFFCSHSCVMKHNNKVWKKTGKTNYSRPGNMNSKKGEFTYYLNQQIPKRQKETDLDESYLSSIWTGYCALSGIKIYKKKGRSKLETASLDRINSNLPYQKGNVQFVSYGLNLAKNSFSNEEMIEFILSIRQSISLD